MTMRKRERKRQKRVTRGRKSSRRGSKKIASLPLKRLRLAGAQVSPQQGDLRLSGPPSGQGAGGEARTCDRRVPADLRADSLATMPPTPLNNLLEIEEICTRKGSQSYMKSTMREFFETGILGGRFRGQTFSVFSRQIVRSLLHLKPAFLQGHNSRL
ncbi:hypothetical protein PoB_001574400 [Plakobranchus ocellatus]|uniref:Uncharacterized protein n=1 Tax=Plakobranchus ocellatus TaxID=259542 RepID=A0AAV3Z4B4_9GAST|nr:hypothetical protein PoB_001574400 [Plakobranchus ocellatus]